MNDVDSSKDSANQCITIKLFDLIASQDEFDVEQTVHFYSIERRPLDT